MFQAWAVKIAKIAAHSAPSSLPGKSPRKNVTVKVRKPSTGTDWRMSRAGMMTSSAFRLLAAEVATTKVNSSDRRIAANMRSVVRSAYSGRLRGSSVIGATSSPLSDALISCAPWAIAANAPAIRMNTMTSLKLGIRPRRPRPSGVGSTGSSPARISICDLVVRYGIKSEDLVLGLNSHQVMARNDDVPMTQGNSDFNILHSFYNRLYAPTCGGDRRFETETADDLLQHCVARSILCSLLSRTTIGLNHREASTTWIQSRYSDWSLLLQC